MNNRIIDIFSGCGGLSTGFEMAGFEVALAIEKDLWAFETYKYNHPETNIINEDITKINYDDVIPKNIVGVIGGPPCQGFSLSGKRDPKDPRNSLFMNFVEIVNKAKPTFFVLENVPGILSMKTSKQENVSEIIIKEFEKIGYKTEYKILNAAEYGVPQTRKRVIFIGIKLGINFDEKELFPKGFLFDKDQITINQAISDLPQIESGEGFEIFEYDKEPLNEYQKWARKKSENIQNHISMRHTKRIIERFKTIKQGQSLSDVSEEHMQRKRGDATKISGKIYSQNNMRPYGDKPSPTIAASFQGNFIHPNLNRNYTAREAARLQSFPDNYIFKGKRTTMSWEKHLSQYQQIGNAVPPLLAKAIADNIIKLLKINLKINNK